MEWCRAANNLYSSGCSGLRKRKKPPPPKEHACVIRNPTSTPVKLKCQSIATTFNEEGTYNVDVRFCRCPPSVRADPAKSAGYDKVVWLEEGKGALPRCLRNDAKPAEWNAVLAKQPECKEKFMLHRPTKIPKKSAETDIQRAILDGGTVAASLDVSNSLLVIGFLPVL